MFGEQVHGLRTFTCQQVAADFELRYAVEDVQQSLFIQLDETLLCALAKEDAACLESKFIILAAVYHYGELFGKALLQNTTSRVAAMLLDERVDGRFVQGGEYLDVALGILVGHVEPELVEGVGTGTVPVEPYITFFGLAELLSVGLCDKRAGQGECFILHAQLTADELGSSSNVAPLVASTHLQFAVLRLVEI